MIDTDELLKVLEGEIERAEHQMSIASTYVRFNNPTSERKKWKKYLKDLHDKYAEIQLLGIQLDDG